MYNSVQQCKTLYNSIQQCTTRDWKTTISRSSKVVHNKQMTKCPTTPVMFMSSPRKYDGQVTWLKLENKKIPLHKSGNS